MSDKISLQASKRTLFGRKIKKLRREGILPANIYGKDVKSLAVQVSFKEFDKAYKEAGETGLISLIVTKSPDAAKGSAGRRKKERPVLIHNLQKDPVTDEFLHVDFRQVDLAKKVTANIPLVFVGQVPAVEKGGVLVHLKDEVEVEALPTDLPDKIEVDTSNLAEIGNSISLKKLKFDTKKVKIIEENLNTLVVKIEEPTKEKEEKKPAEEAAPAEGEKEKKDIGAGLAPARDKKPVEGEEKKPDEAKKPEEVKKEPEVSEKPKQSQKPEGQPGKK